MLTNQNNSFAYIKFCVYSPVKIPLLRAKPVYNGCTSLQGGAQFPTGGKFSMNSFLTESAHEPCAASSAPQIWCKSKADGIVRMKEDDVIKLNCGLRCS